MYAQYESNQRSLLVDSICLLKSHADSGSFDKIVEAQLTMAARFLISNLNCEASSNFVRSRSYLSIKCLPSGHMTSMHCVDPGATLHKRHMPAGYPQIVRRSTDDQSDLSFHLLLNNNIKNPFPVKLHS